MFRIAHDACNSAHDTGTAAQTVPLFAAAFRRCVWFARSIRLRVIDRASRLEAFGGRRSDLVGGEFLFPYGRERAQISGCCRAVIEREYLSQFEIKDVARIIETSDRLQTPARFKEKPANRAKEARALKAKIFAIAHALTCLAHHPK